MQKFDFILLIDDDNVTNFINQKVICKLGCFNKIEVALDGLHAMDIIEKEGLDGKNAPDIILLDINMPVMSGFDFLEQYKRGIHKLSPNSKIIVLTTSSHQKDHTALKSYGIYDIIQKPLTETKLMQVLEKIDN